VTREFLERVPLFADVDDVELDRIIDSLQPVTVPGGATVVREGEAGTTFYLVESGTLLVETEVGGRRRELTRMGPGDFFGEIALLSGGARTATVTASTPALLWSLTAEDFAAIVQTDPQLRRPVRREARARVRRSTANAFEVRHQSLAESLARRKVVRIGRAVDNDIVLTSRSVSDHHAVIKQVGAVVTIEDQHSTSGTFVNGQPVGRADLHDGDEVWIGDERFVFEKTALIDVVRPRGVRIDALDLRKEVKGGHSLLADVSLSVLPGEFVAIVGGSGAGKTTLLDALAGTQPATSGRVLYDGEDRYEHDVRLRSIIGYVPQDDIVHTELGLRRILLHAAAIRLPADTSAAERVATVDHALEQLGLSEQAEIKVGSLSGGQRKRSSIGVELLTEPRAFFLDEPTSGLDPATDGQMMRLLRGLADSGSTVLVTTHATKNVRLCDKVVILGRGGHLAFVGSPARALEHFGVEAFDDIYDVLEPEGAPQQAGQRFLASPEYEQQRALVLAPPVVLADTAGGSGGRGRGRGRGRLRRSRQQLGALSKRNLDIHLRNKEMLLPIVAQPVVLSILLLALFRSGLFEPGQDTPVAPLQLIFLLSFNAFLLGLLTSVQEVVKELPIFYRERAVGVGVVPYILSKTTFLVPAMVIGAMLLIGVPLATNRLPDPAWSWMAPLFLTLVLAALAGMSLALFTSSFVSSSRQATDLLSLWIMPQVLFAGGLFAVPVMDFAGRTFSHVAVLRWAFEASGHAVDMTDVFRRSQSITGRSLLNQYGNSFDCNPLRQWSILAGFIVVPLTLATVILSKRQPRR
jgi:ABC-type multidrug transport system ATPase subunit/CRP-like cAMP-binding protein